MGTTEEQKRIAARLLKWSRAIPYKEGKLRTEARTIPVPEVPAKEVFTYCFKCGEKKALVPGHVVCEGCHNIKRCLRCKRAKRMAKTIS